MSGPLMQSGETCCEPYTPPPLSVRLVERKQKLESELKKVDSAIALMAKTPEIGQLMNVISQLNV